MFTIPMSGLISQSLWSVPFNGAGALSVMVCRGCALLGADPRLPVPGKVGGITFGAHLLFCLVFYVILPAWKKRSGLNVDHNNYS